MAVSKATPPIEPRRSNRIRRPAAKVNAPPPSMFARGQHPMNIRHRANNARTVRQWEKKREKVLRPPRAKDKEKHDGEKHDGENHDEENHESTKGVKKGSVSTWKRGNVIIEQFHGLDMHDLLSKPRVKQEDDYPYRMLEEAKGYTEIPAGHTYIALDSHGRRLVAIFPHGLTDIYGETDVAGAIKNNIELYIQQVKPPFPTNGRHSEATAWLQANPVLDRCGTFQWGVWVEQGNSQKGPVLSRDLLVKGARTIPILRALLDSLGNITRAVNALFGAVDYKMRDEYREAFCRIPAEFGRYMETCHDVELFSLRVLIINAWTQPHRDTKDWHGGWAWLSVLGDFSGGDFCLTELRRRIPFPHGAVAGLRGGALEHWTTHWQGTSRYSIVHVFHQFIREWWEKP
ncbi:MAG: hypothetical protein M1823_001722 [Watsoniomyces obsoletus]|nr:MAG: hypothetical protein M1823_001722 [Watsoniomyces obsoletus]